LGRYVKEEFFGICFLLRHGGYNPRRSRRKQAISGALARLCEIFVSNQTHYLVCHCFLARLAEMNVYLINRIAELLGYPWYLLLIILLSCVYGFNRIHILFSFPGFECPFASRLAFT